MKRFLDSNVFLYAFLNQDVGKKAVAARILAAAEAGGCGEIYTEDLNNGQVYFGIKAVNPFK